MQRTKAIANNVRFSSNKKKVFLTFDVEDAANKQAAMPLLYNILQITEKCNLRGLFFVTGQIAKVIRLYPGILRLLASHKIGYHSADHFVRSIVETADVGSYDKAIKELLRRETSPTNPTSDDSKGSNGIESVRQIFSNKNIESFRAPSFCWTPAHLEALNRLDFRFDFSTEILNVPFFYKEITFYPYPALIFDEINFRSLVKGSIKFLLRFLRDKYLVILFHPHLLTSTEAWNILNNPSSKDLDSRNLKAVIEIKEALILLELFLRTLGFLEKIGLIIVTPDLEKSRVNLRTKEIDIEKIYETTARRYRDYGNYTPRFLLDHFYIYFGNEHKKA